MADDVVAPLVVVDDPETCWTFDFGGCLPPGTWEGYSPEVQSRAMLLAVETLRMLTAYRVAGCPILVRPCREGCLPDPTYMTFPAPGHPATSAPVAGWRPALMSGQWVNIACGCSGPSCSCGPLCELRLPGGIAQVVEVTQDGATLDPSAYRVDDGMSLVRLDGECWPVCQDMARPHDGTPEESAGTLAVLYRTGSLPGRLGEIAAGALAAEYAKACTDQTCVLPSRVRTVARTGVVLDLTTAEGDLWPSGLTGIREADLFIRRLNPHALRTPSAVWSPDVRRARRVRP